MVKSNIAEVVASTTSSGSGGTLTVNLSVTCPPSATGCNVIQQGGVYYLSPILNGYYYCGLQMGNRSVLYTWTLNVSATRCPLRVVQPCPLRSPTSTPYPTSPATLRLGRSHWTLMVRLHRRYPRVWFQVACSQSPRWVYGSPASSRPVGNPSTIPQAQ